MALNLNLTGNNTLSPTVKAYYDRRLIEEMKPKLVHYTYAQKRPMPRNGGKTVSFRKWTPFAAITSPLTEGVVPDGQDLSMTEVTTSVSGYGGYVSISDLLDLTAVDPVVSDSIVLMADQGALSVDNIIREVLHKGTNVMYAGGKSHRYELTASNKLTSADIRKAARLLKKNRAPQVMRGGKGYYVAIVGPDTVYDLQDDTTWQDVGKYQEAEQIFSGEIGRLYGVIVVETPEAKTFAGQVIAAGALTATAAASSAYTAGTKVLTLQQTMTAAEAAALVGKDIVVEISDSSAYTDTVTAASGTALTLKNGYTGTATDLNGKTVYGAAAGKSGASVASTLVVGRDAYGVVDIEGCGNARSIVKPAGSGGTSDPLEQISTVGWKVDAFAASILQQSWMIRIEHGFSA
ncbi:MAG: N4-gp56 family major capsid protein [Eubacteriales bacterium]|nr:N4-gp56 family major capsid protein [Eubacteriales bacterium]